MAPGQYVGVLPDGSIKPPENTRTGPHGRFTVSVHTTSQPNTGPMVTLPRMSLCDSLHVQLQVVVNSEHCSSIVCC